MLITRLQKIFQYLTKTKSKMRKHVNKAYIVEKKIVIKINVKLLIPSYLKCLFYFHILWHDLYLSEIVARL